MTGLILKIRQELPEVLIKENEPLRDYCSFKIGGPVRAMAFPESEAELTGLCAILAQEGIKPLVIGNGTNLLVSDGSLNRFAIKLGSGLAGLERLGETLVCAGSAVSLARLALFCADLALSGLEFAHGIPGTLGGGISMNAGAYGGELKDVLKSVRYLNGAGEICRKAASELELGYRHSVFSGTDDIIISAELSLSPGDAGEINEKIRGLSQRRRDSQPLDKPSAGSTFKRPETGYAAALIDEAGLKGFSIGGAQVSEKHAGFVINKGGASFDDVISLMEHIQKTVYDRSGVLLEPEVKIIR